VSASGDRKSFTIVGSGRGTGLMIEDFTHGLLRRFAGLPVFHLPGPGVTEPDKWPGVTLPTDVEDWAWRVGVDHWDGDEYLTWFDLFLRDVDTTRVGAYIIGNWVTETGHDKSSAQFFEPLIAAADRFPALEALFVGDIHSEQHEVSWIVQDDITPLIAAFPGLKVFAVRGGENLRLQALSNSTLRELTFQSGGLPPEVVRAVGASDLPALTDLELYIGSPEYGGGAIPDDVAEILTGTRLPSLRYLGLRDAENADEIAAAVAHAPIVAQLETLDLSLGNLGDVGAAALLAGQPLTHLKKLDLHHHYMSEEMENRLRDALPGVEVDVSDREVAEDEDWGRYIAVAE
jgi:hypothetical protein